MAPPPDNAPPESNNSTPPPSGDSPSPPSSTPPPEKSPPSSPPPSSPPPSSPPPSSPRSPPPSSPPPKNDSPSPPSPNSNSSSSAKPPSSSSAPPPSPTLTASPPPPSTNNSAPAPPGLFSPPPPIADKAGSPPREPAHKVPSSSSSTPSDSSDSSPSSQSSSDGPNAAVIAVVVVGGVLLLSLVVVCLIFMRRKNKEKTYYTDPMRGPPKGGHGDYYHGNQQWNNSPADHIVKLPPPSGGGGWGPPPPNNSSDSSNFSGSNQSPSIPNMGLGFSKSQFSYEELASATSGFSQANLLGQGGFGYVHKGVLPNGQEVAVKSLKSGSGQGEREFQAEVEIISRVHHRHLVSLVGYCIANEQRMLVYEFVANSTLEFHLYGKGRPVMDWETRLRIAIGSARGLAYLHEDCHPRIIHRDIKAANILLDNNFEAMVADFGLAKLSSDNFTHVSTRVMGTFGYLAPEYASSGKLTEKSDVFSFGVMLLELITGRKPVDPTSKYMDDSLVDWARPLMTRVLEDGNFDELVDPRLEDNFNPQEMTRMVASAAASIRHSARRRPKMSQIVRTLEGNASLDDLNDGGLKASQSSTILGTTQAYDTGAYNADMVKFRKMVLSTEEFPSAEHGRTSDH